MKYIEKIQLWLELHAVHGMFVSTKTLTKDEFATFSAICSQLSVCSIIGAVTSEQYACMGEKPAASATLAMMLPSSIVDNLESDYDLSSM